MENVLKKTIEYSNCKHLRIPKQSSQWYAVPFLLQIMNFGMLRRIKREYALRIAIVRITTSMITGSERSVFLPCHIINQDTKYGSGKRWSREIDLWNLIQQAQNYDTTKNLARTVVCTSCLQRHLCGYIWPSSQSEHDWLKVIFQNKRNHRNAHASPSVVE